MSLLDTFAENFVASLATGTLGIGSIFAWIARSISPRRSEERRKQRLDSLDASFARSAEVDDFAGMAKIARQRERLVRRWSRNADRPALRLFGRAYVFVGSFLLLLGGFWQQVSLDENGWPAIAMGGVFLAVGNISVDLIMDRHEKAISDADKEMIAKRCEQIGIVAPNFPAPLTAIDKGSDKRGGGGDSADTQTATSDESKSDADQDS